MRRIAFMGSAGMSGTDYCEVEEVPDETTNEQLNQEAWDRAVDWASMYGVEQPSDEYNEDEEEDWDDRSGYWDNVEGYWEEYDYEKHGSLKSGGGKWFDDDPD